MLVIRDEQMAVFNERSRQMFVSKMHKNLRSEFPEKTDSLGNDELDEMIEQGINRAKLYEITVEQDVQFFIERCFFYSQDFDKSQPWVANILNDQNYSGPEKIEKIEQYEVLMDKEMT